MASQCQTFKKLWTGHESAQTDGQTDRRTDRGISIYPLDFVRGGINIEFIVRLKYANIKDNIITKRKLVHVQNLDKHRG